VVSNTTTTGFKVFLMELFFFFNLITREDEKEKAKTKNKQTKENF